MSRLRLGTRGSALALAQSSWVKRQIEERHGQVELCVIKTSGDRLLDAPLENLGGKGVFTKEIEDALLRGEIDFAVHSLKDLPTVLPQDLVLAAVPKREDARDVLVCRIKGTLSDLPLAAKLGTGSLRRKAQLLGQRSDLKIAPVRGNIDTRLRKLDAGEFDALVMAAAGLKRIGRTDRIDEFLADDVCVSAVAQGALGIESRNDPAIREQLNFLYDAVSFTEVTAERSFLDRLGGSCRVPIGARARVAHEKLVMVGVVANPDGKKFCRGEIAGLASDAVALGRRLAEELLMQGADKILASV